MKRSRSSRRRRETGQEVGAEDESAAATKHRNSEVGSRWLVQAFLPCLVSASTVRRDRTADWTWMELPPWLLRRWVGLFSHLAYVTCRRECVVGRAFHLSSTGGVGRWRSWSVPSLGLRCHAADKEAQASTVRSSPLPPLLRIFLSSPATDNYDTNGLFTTYLDCVSHRHLFAWSNNMSAL